MRQSSGKVLEEGHDSLLGEKAGGWFFSTSNVGELQEQSRGLVGNPMGDAYCYQQLYPRTLDHAVIWLRVSGIRTLAVS